MRAWSPRKGCLHADNQRVRYEIIVKIGNVYNYGCNLRHVDADRRTAGIAALFSAPLQLRRRVFTQHLRASFSGGRRLVNFPFGGKLLSRDDLRALCYSFDPIKAR